MGKYFSLLTDREKEDIVVVAVGVVVFLFGRFFWHCMTCVVLCCRVKSQSFSLIGRRLNRDRTGGSSKYRGVCVVGGDRYADEIEGRAYRLVARQQPSMLGGAQPVHTHTHILINVKQ